MLSRRYPRNEKMVENQFLEQQRVHSLAWRKMVRLSSNPHKADALSNPKS